MLWWRNIPSSLPLLIRVVSVLTLDSSMKTEAIEFFIPRKQDTSVIKKTTQKSEPTELYSQNSQSNQTDREKCHVYHHSLQ